MLEYPDNPRKDEEPKKMTLETQDGSIDKGIFFSVSYQKILNIYIDTLENNIIQRLY